MSGGWSDRAGTVGGGTLRRLGGPLLGGFLAAVLVALTLVVAIVLGMEEQAMFLGSPTTVVARAPTGTTSPLPPTATSLPDTPQPTPTPTSTPSPSMTPSPLPTLKADCPPPPQGWQVHKVGKRDTLQSLASRFGTTGYRLLQVNCLQKAHEVYEGREIYVPAEPLPTLRPKPQATRCVPQTPPGWVTYVVQRGDTLSSLARRTGTTVARLQEVNCLSSTQIYIGQRLSVPRTVSPPTPTRRPSRTPTVTVSSSKTPGPTATDSPTPASGTETATSAAPTDTPPPAGPTDTAQPPTATTKPGGTPVSPTDTPPAPTDTPVPPTNTMAPPTNTPVPPTNTTAPPTNTPKPPTSTPKPPTDTPPTSTPVPTEASDQG